ncbi:DUF1206 domain-containing protein [Croceicoccus naphthovorans]|uniref:Uncharacterized protein n=1 Tax=Croceicoccus naphthovorans TaxID=1348774 RepID=A0A0G3XHK8_9SPHN|nr:DUF1206 domain-containing protein [Croceicoccus naphthovorans]AKM10079.1 hypothetical protein AB433_08980 [Croceicoccus naphthovorans]MBB3991201.1 putative membrane protein [Croceicoccus naphthovorans]
MVDKSEKFNWGVRLGYAARGLVYGLLGYIALTSRDEVREGPAAAFNHVQDNLPLGSVILWLAALGLLAYAIYRFASLLFDVEHQGSDNKGWMHRIGHGASGVAHLVLAYTAVQYASGSGSSGDSTQEAANTVLSMTLGGLLLGIVGIGFLVAGVMQGKKGITGSFMNRVSGAAPSFTKPVGQAGHVARAVVFLIIGWSLVQSGFLSSGNDVKSLGDAIASLSDNGMIFTLVALGLVLFGVFSIIVARYRIIPDLGPEGLRPEFRYNG